MPLPRCQHYRVTTRDGDPLAIRCRRRGRWRVAGRWCVCATCLPDVLALRATPTSVEELK